MVKPETDSEKFGYLKTRITTITSILKNRGTNSAKAVYAIQEQIRLIEEETDINIRGNSHGL